MRKAKKSLDTTEHLFVNIRTRNLQKLTTVWRCAAQFSVTNVQLARLVPSCFDETCKYELFQLLVQIKAGQSI
jgi:hypothetical protein